LRVRGYELPRDFALNPLDPETHINIKFSPRPSMEDKASFFIYMKHCTSDIYGVPSINFFPSLHSQYNVVSAIQHRIGCVMPERKVNSMMKFINFARNHFKNFGVCRKWYTLEDWLASTNYTIARKKQLMDSVIKMDYVRNRCASFIKFEGYGEVKAPRTINSYPDQIKVMLGPFIKSLEKHFFNKPFFVKGLNNTERDNMLRNVFSGSKVGFTDFSSMEAHHFGHFAQLYVDFVDYMRGGMFDTEFSVFKDLVLGNNILSFPRCGVSATIRQRLMSGALWTSFLNSFINLFLLKYFRFRVERNFDFDRLDTFVEGDDGIFLSFRIREKIVKNLGLKLKINFSPDFNRASFCGRVITRDSCITDPLKILRKFSTFSMKYYGCKETKMLSLMKARCQSYLTEYNGTPILTKFCERFLSKYRYIDGRYGASQIDEYHALDWTIKAKSINDESRPLCEEMFGVSQYEQSRMESVISNYDFVGPLKIDMRDNIRIFDLHRPIDNL